MEIWLTSGTPLNNLCHYCIVEPHTPMCKELTLDLFKYLKEQHLQQLVSELDELLIKKDLGVLKNEAYFVLLVATIESYIRNLTYIRLLVSADKPLSAKLGKKYKKAIKKKKCAQAIKLLASMLEQSSLIKPSELLSLIDDEDKFSKMLLKYLAGFEEFQGAYWPQIKDELNLIYMRRNLIVHNMNKSLLFSAKPLDPNLLHRSRKILHALALAYEEVFLISVNL